MPKAKFVKLYRAELTIRIGHPLLKQGEELPLTPISINVVNSEHNNMLDIVIDFEDGDRWDISYQGDFLIVWPESTAST